MNPIPNSTGATDRDGRWQVEVYTVSFGKRMQTPGLTFAPVFLSATMVGGCDTAEVRVTGEVQALWQITDWLQSPVRIRNQKGTLVWWGYVEQASVGVGAVQVGRSLEGLVNRVQVAYTEQAADGAEVRGTTAWAQDDASVAVYGRFELREGQAELGRAAAEKRRDALLAQRAQPRALVQMSGGGTHDKDTGGGDSGGLLVCKGWWQTLARTFHADNRGRQEYTPNAGALEPIGWALTDNSFGRTAHTLTDLEARFGRIVPGSWIHISGSQNIDGAYRVASGPNPEQTAVTYVSNLITFEAADDIMDDLSGLGFAAVDRMLVVSGAGQSPNNGIKWVQKVRGPGSIEVQANSIVNEAKGPAITIRAGHALTISGTFGAEPSLASTITIRHGSLKVAQRFRLESMLGWTVREVWVQAQKVGNPSDGLRVRIYWGSDVEPGGVLASATVPAASVPATMEWVHFDLGAGIALAPNTDYWLCVDRVGAAHHEDFYQVGLEEKREGVNFEYPCGLKVQHPVTAAWVARDPDARLPFRLSGRTDTMAQLSEMLGSAAWLTGLTNRLGASGVEVSPWRDGEQTLRTEVEALLETGTADGRPLLVTVQSDRSVMVEPPPASTSLNLRYGLDGLLRLPHGAHLAEGILPVGRWVTVEGLPSAFAQAAHFLVAEAEYDVETGRLVVVPHGQEEERRP